MRQHSGYTQQIVPLALGLKTVEAVSQPVPDTPIIPNAYPATPNTATFCYPGTPFSSDVVVCFDNVATQNGHFSPHPSYHPFDADPFICVVKSYISSAKLDATKSIPGWPGLLGMEKNGIWISHHVQGKIKSSNSFNPGIF